MALPPEIAIVVATFGRAIELLIHAPQAIDSARMPNLMRETSRI
jgi:hypothetical protein